MREHDFEKFAPMVDMPLDAGIRPYVGALRSGAVETFESCEGGAGHAFTESTIWVPWWCGRGVPRLRHCLPAWAARFQA